MWLIHTQPHDDAKCGHVDVVIVYKTNITVIEFGSETVKFKCIVKATAQTYLHCSAG